MDSDLAKISLNVGSSHLLTIGVVSVSPLFETTHFYGRSAAQITELFVHQKADFGILEVDKNVLSLVLSKLKPKFVMTLNLLRDQLDRLGVKDKIKATRCKA